MPRKVKTPATNVQNRESQRRSRARRKELVDDLSRQLDQYKRRGVEATLEMQTAAKAVLMENQGLRDLLRLHGISQDTISRHLSSLGSAPCGTPGTATYEARTSPSLESFPTRSLTSKAAVTNTLPSPEEPPSSIRSPIRSVPAAVTTSRPQAHLSTPTMSSPATRHDSHTTKTLRPRRGQEYNHRQEYNDHQSCKLARNFEARTTDDILDPVSDCFCPPGQSPTTHDHTEALETSCDAAAAILVELHGQTDPAQARDALGCVGTSSCSVKNTTLFGLMERPG